MTSNLEINLIQEFKEACRTGNIEYVKEIYRVYPTIDISAYNELAFKYACMNGHLELVKLLYHWKQTIDISSDNEQAFRWACKKGHLEVIRQLYTWKPTIDISAKNEYAFEMACVWGHKDVIKQLLIWKPTIDFSKFISGFNSEIRKYIMSIATSNNLTKELIPEGHLLECPICRDNIHGECMVTKCGHKYCANCINQWLENNITCPYCRTLI